MPKVSVIVPVYNVKAYLEKCVDSVLAQTERDYELLLIDDGSTDGSGELCDRLAEKDGRIRVIHQENRGLGGARNTGIAQAAGEWLLFPDSDDWIEPETLETALRAAERENADLVIFGFQSVDEQGRALRTVVENQPETPLLCYPAAWNKLYRRALFEKTGALYPPRVWYEDIRTTPKLMTAAGKIVFTDYVGYRYLQRAGSIMKDANVDRNREILDAFDDLLSWFRERGLWERYRDQLEYLCLYHAYLTASVRVIRLNRKHPLIPEFAAYVEERFPRYRENPYLSRLSKNERLLFSLLEKRQYLPIELIFRVKG